MHTLLPKKAIDLLKQAAATPENPANPLAKTIAVEMAIKKVKQEYPNYFKGESPCHK